MSHSVEAEGRDPCISMNQYLRAFGNWNKLQCTVHSDFNNDQTFWKQMDFFLLKTITDIATMLMPTLMVEVMMMMIIMMMTTTTTMLTIMMINNGDDDDDDDEDGDDDDDDDRCHKLTCSRIKFNKEAETKNK